MSDHISAEERALIDAAVEAGRVEVFGTGESSYPGYVFDAKKGLVSKEPDKAGWRAAHQRGKRKSDRVAKRRIKAAEMYKAGVPVAKIACDFGVSEPVIYADLREMGFRRERSGPRSRYDPAVQDRREKVRAAYSPDKDIYQISEESGVPRRSAWDHLKALGLKPAPTKYRRKDKKATAAAERRQRIPALIEAGLTGPEIAEKLKVSTATIHYDCQAIGVKIPRRKRKSIGGRGGVPQRAGTYDRRRFKSPKVPRGEARVLSDADATGTVFPKTVETPSDAARVLKDGASNRKIGGDVLVGWLKGAKIYTLTLEERATCPESCLLWEACYGNGMHFSTRWRHGQDLEERIRAEVEDLCGLHEKVLIRLHILGDFYSSEYLKMWAGLIEAYGNLFVFGFTAHQPGTEIGDEIANLRTAVPGRFFIRHSDRSGPWGTVTLGYPTKRKRVGDAVVCIEQREAIDNGDESRMHCGTCGLCWKADVPIAFVMH